jgi:glutamate formiminotransferase/formiminotetrahydrofolate cyclodeaminase
MRKIIECVPNFSEGRDPAVLEQIAAAIRSAEGVTLLDVDPGKATNRTVMTLVGEPDAVVEGAFRGIAKAAELLDMRTHRGEHPRFGATDVCPFVPVSGADMQDCIACARALGERVGAELGIPVYLYEAAATAPHRKNLASVRAGEYEGIAAKISQPEWKPDFGPAALNARSGNIAIGARDFLVAFNVNLNTTSVRRANSVAFDVREQGRIQREGDPINGPVVKDEKGEPVRIPGTCKAVKAIGWFIEEYGIAQVSMNLTDLKQTPLHKAFDACVESAHQRGMRVTGSELVGLVPLNAMLDAGRYFMEKQQRSTGLSDAELVRLAIRSMGLDELGPFDPQQRIIEWRMANAQSSRLVSMSLKAFCAETASESPAPGGGSVSAYLGALGASLGAMVANLSSHKPGWDARWKEFSQHATEGQRIAAALLDLVDEDTRSFDAILQAFRLPKDSPEEKAARSQAIQEATLYATQVPLRTMEWSVQALPLLLAMAQKGNPNSVTDAAVGALCARSAALGAALNVRINASGLKDQVQSAALLARCAELEQEAVEGERRVLQAVEALMSKQG